MNAKRDPVSGRIMYGSHDRSELDIDPIARVDRIAGAVFGAFALVAVVLWSAFLSGCNVVSAEAIKQARTETAINSGHARDKTLPVPARQIASDNALAWEAQHHNLTGDHLPPPTALAADEVVK